MVQTKPDLLTAASNPPLLALKDATSAIPIVMAYSHAAVEVGLVGSLRHPGGNVTGIDAMSPELDAKRLQFLRELAPMATSIATLYNPDADPGIGVHISLQATAARSLGFDVQRVEVKREPDFDAVFASLAKDKPDALFTLADGLTFTNRVRIAEFALSQPLPSLFEFAIFVDSGGLYSYVAILADGLRRAADLA